MTLAVSATLSPLAAEDEAALDMEMTFPPSSYMAASKLMRVLVEGSKKRVASFFPWQISEYFSGWAMMSLAQAMSSSSSCVERSTMSIRLLFIYLSAPVLIQLSSEGLFLKAMSLWISSGLIYPCSAATSAMQSKLVRE